ncbi:MAG: DoxX family protein [Betaproteobacteria bacterium]|nr:DoxX family protein [Betaproteobacteria bacterium]
MPLISIPSVLQAIVGLGLLNVWLIRAASATAYRGGAAKTIKEEFAAYGLPNAAMYVVGALKIAAGVILIAGLWMPLPVTIAAGVVAVLMVGALAMHLKVGDQPVKFLPAALMLAMCIAIVMLHQA